jgi:hypothetical protein
MNSIASSVLVFLKDFRLVHYLLVILIITVEAFGQSSTAGTIRGTVIDPQDKPVEGATVRLFNKEKKESKAQAAIVTDERGEFYLPQIPPGNYKITVSHDLYENDEKPDFHINQGEQSLVRPHPPIFTLGETALVGRIVNSTGQGLQGFKIRAADASGIVQKTYLDPDPDGSYVFRYLPLGHFKITISCPGYKETIIDFPNYPRSDNNQPRYIVPIAPITLYSTDEPSQTAPPTNKDSKDRKADKSIKNLTSLESYQDHFYGYEKFTFSRDISRQEDWPLSKSVAFSSRFNNTYSTLGHQSSTKLIGKVVDKADNGLPDVTVTLFYESNDRIFVTFTDLAGEYRITDLLPGNYRISALKSGYREDRVSSIHVKSAPEITKAENITLDKKLADSQTPSQPKQELEIGTEQLSAVSSFSVGRFGNFNETQIIALPLGGTTEMRSFDELAFLLPGVAPPPFTPGMRGPGVGFGVGTAGKFSVNGSRARSNNFTIDGSDNNDPDVGVRRQGFVALVPQTIESINEFQMLTLLWDAELGRNIGSQVNLVSKYGGNAYHMQLYAFFTDSRLNARNFFDYIGGVSGGENPSTRIQQGLVGSGPIVHDRTHFFISFEQIIIKTSIEQHFSSPRPDERGFLGRSRIGVLDPLFQNNPNIFFKGKRKAPLGNNILSFYPEPNNPGGPFGDNTYSEVLPASGKGYVGSAKITHSFAENKNLEGRYNFTNDHRTLPSVNRAIRSTLSADTRTQNLSLIFNSDLSSTVFNQSRFSYGRTRLTFIDYPDSPLNFASNSTARIINSGRKSKISSETGAIGELTVEPFSPVGVDVAVFPQLWVDNTFQFADTAIISRNRHSTKFGFDIRRVQLNSRQERNYRPKVVFGNAQLIFGNVDLSINNDPDDPAPFDSPPSSIREFVSGVSLAAVGLPSSIFQTLTLGPPDPTIGLRFTELSLFFNDSWRVRSGFTLDYGLRYEYNTVPQEVNERIERTLRPETILNAQQSVFDSKARRDALDAAVSAYTKIIDGRTRIYDSDSNNFGPHIGFVWVPAFNSKKVHRATAIRGGYGIYFDTIMGAVVSQSRNVFPSEIPINVDPTLGSFDIFNLRNPGILQVSRSRSAGSIPLIALGTLNQLGGEPRDAAAIIGDLFLKNKQGGGLAFTLPAKNLPTPYAQQWHLTLERQITDDLLLSAAYVGTKGTNLTRLTTPNFGPNLTLFIPVATTFTARKANDNEPSPLDEIGLPSFLIIPKKAESIRRERPIPSLGAYQIFENSANSVYHALQLEARKRYSNRYTLNAAYTWSHAMDDVSDIFPISGAPILPQDSSNPHLERASANFDIRHRFAASLIWDLPFSSAWTGIKKRWLSGWQAAAIFQANTGQPFTLLVPADANFDGNLTDRPSTTEGLIFSNKHGARRISVDPNRKVSDFFIFGKNGIVGRNIIRGDGFINLDVAFNKNFELRQNIVLKFRAEFFNALNRANFGLPINTIGAPGFGQSVDTINPGRVVQFALKLLL